MIHRLSTSAACLGAIVCVLACATPLFAQDADILGNWDVTVSAGQGPETSAPLVLKRDGDQIVGTFSGPQGDHAIHIVYSGTVEKDSMKGTVKLGDLGDGTFTAKKKS